jgi:hypothetical protein
LLNQDTYANANIIYEQGHSTYTATIIVEIATRNTEGSSIELYLE